MPKLRIEWQLDLDDSRIPVQFHLTEPKIPDDLPPFESLEPTQERQLQLIDNTKGNT